MEILQANDLLTQGVLLYKQVMEGRVIFGNTVSSTVGDIPVSRGKCREPPPSLCLGAACKYQKRNDSQNILGYDVEMRKLDLFLFPARTATHALMS